MSDARSGTTAGDDLASVALIWIGLPVAAMTTVWGGLVWTAGQLSGLLAHGRWPDVPASEAWSLGLALPQYPTDATEVWGAESVGPVWLVWSVLTLLLTLAALLAWWVASRWLRRSSSGRADSGARWATRAEEKEMSVGEDPASRPGRLVAGRGMLTRRLLAADDCISAVGFGPNGSGKTTGLIAPNVLEWAGSVVMTTTKLADLALIHEQRASVGPVWVIAPGVTGQPHSCGWSPVDYSLDAEAADRMAEWLVEASGMSADPKSRPWLVQARKYVKPLLLAAHLSGGGIDAFVRWVYAGQDAADDVRDILLSAGEQDTWREYTSTWSIHAEGVGSVLFTAYGLADTYSRPSVRRSVEQGGFSPGDLFGDTPGTLVIVAPESDVERFAPMFTALIAAVVHEAEQRAAAAGGPINPRLLLALDEAGNVFRYPRIANLLTTARGNGVQLLLVYHDIAQIEQLFGRQVARTVLSNAKMRILLPGQGDLETLRYFSSMLGQARVSRSSITRSHGGQRSTSTGDHSEELAPVHVLRGLPADVAVMQYRNLPGTRVRLRFCFDDRTRRHLAAT